MSKFGHFLPVFCPYLEFSAWLSLAMSATLKYIVDIVREPIYDLCAIFAIRPFICDIVIYQWEQILYHPCIQAAPWRLH